jgi:1-acyl-sn-glycerol-3-phosphate acyltransferase
VPVVPIALKTDAWGLGRRLKDFGPIRPDKRVHIAFGDPLRITGSGKEAHQSVMDFIEKNVSAWK